MIAEALAGRRLLVTGATGFVGTALVERLLRSVPGCELVLLVRPGRRSTAQRRVEREVLRNDCFDRLRSELGRPGFEAMAAERVRVVAGDVGRDGLGLDAADRDVVAGCDVVVHSAATVAFDAPLDAAVEVNLLGPHRIAATLAELGVAPHLVSVSTCYVAGHRRGAAPERLVTDDPWFVEVDWRREVAAARRARDDAEAESRTPEALARFHQAARRELGGAGPALLAERGEALRRRWVDDRMVEAGRARAASLGWPDAYAYTKALGEVALLEGRGQLPVTIVRPSIIESALAEPRPGWIRGFRMAEPIILSYARGLLREFPGVPEGTIDVIPVDLVVAAVVAAAAAEPPAEPEVLQVATGSANPLRYGELVGLVQRWFSEHPLYDATGQPISVPPWTFPGRGRVQGQLERAKAALGAAERVLTAVPLRGARAEWGARVEERREQVERALGYVELYGAYTECEAIYGVERLLDRWQELPEADRARFCFDPRVVSWPTYVQDVHLPSVVEHGRVRTSPGTRSEPREQRLRRQVLAPERHLAAFDLEGTLVAANVVSSYAWLATRRLPWDDRVWFVARTLREAPALLAQDRRDRSDFLRLFYRRYEGADAAELAEDAPELFAHLLLARSFPAALRRVRRHRELGHRTLLITGALDVVVEPLRPLFDDVVCARLGREGGHLTGELEAVPPTGEARAQVLWDYAAAHGLDVAEAVAYADAASDLPLLDAVGFPVAVNPEPRLASIARSRGWLVERWERAPGTPAPLLPLAPRWARERWARTAGGVRP